MGSLVNNHECEIQIKTVPIKYMGDKYNENLILLEFQGRLNVSRVDTETGELIPSESPDDYDGVSIGKLLNCYELHSNLCDMEDGGFIDKLVQHSKTNPIELEIGYYTLTGKVVKLERPLAIIQNSTNGLEDTLNIYKIVNYKLVFEKRPHFSV